MKRLVVLAHAPPEAAYALLAMTQHMDVAPVLAGHRMDRLSLVACFVAHKARLASAHAGIFVGAALICSAARVVSHVMREMARRRAAPAH